jgi:hypothetical protein
MSLLAPPLRAIRMAVLAATNSLHRNTAESVAHITGGEFFRFHDPKSMERDLIGISHHVPNRYLISFSPKVPHPGLHVLQVRLPQYPNLQVSARNNYWIDEPPQPSPSTPAR